MLVLNLYKYKYRSLVINALEFSIILWKMLYLYVKYILG